MLAYTLRQLEYFVATAEQESVAGAAARLNISQPSVSNAILKLEDHFGVQLFVRHHAQGVTLTPAGRRVLADARNLLRHASDLLQTARAAGDAATGQLELGCFITLAPLFLPSLVDSFAERHPDASLTLHEGTQDELVEGLRSGQFELALLYDLDLPDMVTRIPVATYKPYVLLPEDHELAANPSVSLSDLAEEPLVLLDVTPSRDYFTGLFLAAGIEPNVRFTSASLEMVRGMVGRGLGCSLLVTRPYGDYTYDGRRIAARPLSDDASVSAICLAHLAQARPTHMMEIFIDFCAAWFARTAQPGQEKDGTSGNFAL